MEKINVCPVCGGDNISTVLSCKDYVASGEIFCLTRCNHCTFLFTNPRPTADEIGRYYQSDKYVSHAGNKDDFSFMYKIYDWVRDYSINKKIDHIKTYHTKGKLMDLGCGLGYFLDGVIKDGVFDAIGVDVSDEAVTYVKNKFGYQVYNENELDMFTHHSFDVITQWHVLEHVHLLNNRMEQLKNLLSKTGTMFIAVPNSNSWDANYYKEFWDGYDVPRHLYHFNQKSFTHLISKHGFKIVETKNMPFDAPYISMRSEVHKGNSFEMIRGAISGLRSTVAAQRNNDHSSLLFVVQHA